MKKFGKSLIVASIMAVSFLFISCGATEKKDDSDVNNKEVTEKKDDSDTSNKEEIEKNEDKVEEETTEKEVSKNEDMPLEKDTIKPTVDLYKSATKVPIKNLLRDPDKYEGKTVIVSGIVKQVLDTDENTIQLGISDEMTEEAMILIYERKKGEKRFLEEDYISAIVEFTGVQSLEVLSGEKKSFPVGEVKKIDLGYVMSSTILVNNAIEKIGGNYKIIYDEQTYIAQQVDKSCYLFRVYDVDNKCYKEERLASDLHNVYWYNKETLQVSEPIYENQYQ